MLPVASSKSWVGSAFKFALTSLIVWAGFSGGVSAKEPPAAVAASEIRLQALPAEGRETWTRIRQGGPFSYEKDGTVFGNRERLLPAQPRGHYREYTVPTPGLNHRGARRIVAGSGADGDVRSSGEYWYTADHYRSFRRIKE